MEKVNNVQQVCIVTRDLGKTMEGYWNILGIGPWAVFDLRSDQTLSLSYHDKPVHASHRGAVAQVGALELELFETIEGPSVYQDWIDEHGEGLHHLKFVPSNMAEAERRFRYLGFPPILSGDRDGGGFRYFDTSPLGCIWEISSRDRRDGPPAGSTPYPENPGGTSPTRVKVTSISHVGICVKDVVSAAEDYWHILGIGPWRIGEWGSRVLYHRCYEGKPAWGRRRIARCCLGDLHLDLVQPIEGESMYHEWSSRHGPSLHHLGFSCEDVDEVERVLREQGARTLESGHTDGPNGTASYCYIEVPALHCIWKPMNKSAGEAIEPLRQVPENSTTRGQEG